MMRVKAQYHKATLPEHQGNPFIEALPPKKDYEYLMKAFTHYPKHDDEVRSYTALEREDYTSRLKTLRQPLPIYYDCFRSIESAIKHGYLAKNPLSPTTAQYLHYPVDDKPNIEPSSGFFEAKGDGLTLIGDSGVGKSSMLEQVLNYFPSVIEHDIYNNKKMEHRNQVVWIKVDCPDKSSVRDLCEEILVCLDIAMESYSQPEATIGKLVRQIEQRIKSSFLGILVIDEMQRLEFKRTGGENNLLNFLHNLMNKLGVPIFFCANPPFHETLSTTLKAARRAESGGYFVMQPLERSDPWWQAFIEELWVLQWTNIETELTEELNNKLHTLSVGNLDLAHRIYKQAQNIVIGLPDETISCEVLEQAFAIACGLSSETEEIINRRDCLLIPRSSNTKNKNKSKQASKAGVFADINRPQHPEFEIKLRELQLAVNLHEIVEDPTLFQKAEFEDEPMKYLRNTGIVLDDPLTLFN